MTRRYREWWDWDDDRFQPRREDYTEKELHRMQVGLDGGRRDDATALAVSPRERSASHPERADAKEA